MPNIDAAVRVINDARQLAQLVSERPCINSSSAAARRATAIGYAELTRLKQMLAEAVLHLTPAQSSPAISADFPRPMGATPTEQE